jgi:hypothetical protein
MIRDLYAIERQIDEAPAEQRRKPEWHPKPRCWISLPGPMMCCQGIGTLTAG